MLLCYELNTKNIVKKLKIEYDVTGSKCQFANAVKLVFL